MFCATVKNLMLDKVNIFINTVSALGLEANSFTNANIYILFYRYSALKSMIQQQLKDDSESADCV